MLNIASSSCFSSDLTLGTPRAVAGCDRSPGLECCDDSSGDEGWLPDVGPLWVEEGCADKEVDELPNPGGGIIATRFSCCS